MPAIMAMGSSSGISPIECFMSIIADNTTVAAKPATIPLPIIPDLIGPLFHSSSSPAGANSLKSQFPDRPLLGTLLSRASAARVLQRLLSRMVPRQVHYFLSADSMIKRYHFRPYCSALLRLSTCSRSRRQRKNRLLAKKSGMARCLHHTQRDRPGESRRP